MDRILPSTTGVPPLATDQITPGLPIHAIRATSPIGVSGRGGAIRPPRVEEAIMGTLAVGGILSLDDLGGVTQDAGESSSEGGRSRQQGGEADHDAARQKFVASLVLLVRVIRAAFERKGCS